MRPWIEPRNPSLPSNSVHSHDNEPVTLRRDVEAIMGPAGIPVTLREGKTGFITQALGGSFTVYFEGNLFRLAGKDADALGKEVVVGPELPPNATDAVGSPPAWRAVLQTCFRCCGRKPPI